MTIERALEVLKHFNKWRRGAKMPMPNPKEIGIALDTAIKVLEKEVKLQNRAKLN